jgi:site-specific DNA-methyltransferase (adenine-specific)
MKNIKTMLSSESVEWGTPQGLFNELNESYNFTLDPCATPLNAKCQKFFTKEQDGLIQSWENETVFCNPPYGRDMPKWIKKCYEESSKATIVLLMPSRTDTKYFHDYVLGKAHLAFIKGRLKFEGLQKGSGSAPFPSLLAFYNCYPTLKKHNGRIITL